MEQGSWTMNHEYKTSTLYTRTVIVVQGGQFCTSDDVVVKTEDRELVQPDLRSLISNPCPCPCTTNEV